MSAPDGTLITRDGWHYKIGARGMTYRFDGQEWKRTTCQIEVTDSGVALRMPRTKQRVVNADYVHPPSALAGRR